MNTLFSSTLRTILAVVVTLIINLFSTGITLAEDTTPDNATSTAYCLPALDEALNQAFGNPSKVTTINESQQALVNQWETSAQWLSALKTDKVLEGRAGLGRDIKPWLIAKGFNLDIPATARVAAAVFDIDLKWSSPGRASTIDISEKTYAGAKFVLDGTNCKVKKGISGKPIFYLQTVGGAYEVIITEHSGNETGLALIDAEKNIHENTTPYDDFESAQFVLPKVKMDTLVDVSYLIGMSSSDFRIEQALKGVKMNLSETGVQASSAVAFITKGFSFPYTIDSKFMVSIRKKGFSQPAFVALCDKDSWVQTTR